MRRFASFIVPFALICLFNQPVYSDGKGNRQIQSFIQAKRILIKEIYRGHQKTFYCGSQYTQGGHVIHNNGYIPRRKSQRARQLEWEHIVHLDSFGYKFAEWRDGHPQCMDSRGKPFKGPNCAEKMNIHFRFMQSDLYNLVPVIGEIKDLRANYRYGMIPGEKAKFGNCDIEIAYNKVEPPQALKGDVSRIHFYMDSAYPAYDLISPEEQKLFEVWDQQDPVDAWECTRAKRIEAIQNNENPFVKKACVAAGLWP